MRCWRGGGSPARTKTAHSNTSTELLLKINTIWKRASHKKNTRLSPCYEYDWCTSDSSHGNHIQSLLTSVLCVVVSGFLHHALLHYVLYTSPALQNKWLRQRATPTLVQLLPPNTAKSVRQYMSNDMWEIILCTSSDGDKRIAPRGICLDRWAQQVTCWWHWETVTRLTYIGRLPGSNFETLYNKITSVTTVTRQQLLWYILFFPISVRQQMLCLC